MKKICTLIFAIAFVPLAVYSYDTAGWVEYNVQNQTTKEIVQSENDVKRAGIVGEDDRIEITGIADENQKPTVTLKVMWFDKEKGLMGSPCSGALVGENLVLTAAHCVVQNGKLVNVNEIYAAGVPGGAYAYVDRIFIPKEYKDCDEDSNFAECTKYDYAIVSLINPLGERLGFLGTKIHRKRELLNKKVQILGKGGDKPSGTLWVSNGEIGTVDDNFLWCNADSVRGLSGGPMVLSDDPHNIVAVNIMSQPERGEYRNGGVMITPALQRMIAQLRTHYRVVKEIKDKSERLLRQIDKDVKNSY